MDHRWAKTMLEKFSNAADGAMDYQATDEIRKRCYDEALSLEPIAQRIMSVYESGLSEYQSIGSRASPSSRWEYARESALRAAGLAESYVALQENLKPDSPFVSADELHHWVWAAAEPMWEAGAHQEAVNTAARVVNARIQQKAGRHDIGEYDLIMQIFDPHDPEPGKPRLRLPGDRTKPSWRSQQEGVKLFGAGCFRAIRNPAAHEEQVDWSEQVTLEYLAALSALARWVEMSSVENAGE
jgi:hypothetical protein